MHRLQDCFSTTPSECVRSHSLSCRSNRLPGPCPSPANGHPPPAQACARRRPVPGLCQPRASPVPGPRQASARPPPGLRQARRRRAKKYGNYSNFRVESRNFFACGAIGISYFPSQTTKFPWTCLECGNEKSLRLPNFRKNFRNVQHRVSRRVARRLNAHESTHIFS